MPFDMLTLDEAAERARISRRKLDLVLAAGTGPAVTCIGTRRLVRTDMLADWLAACTRQPVAIPQQAAA